VARSYVGALRRPAFVLRLLATGFVFGGVALYIASAASFVIDTLKLPATGFGWLFMPMIAGLVGGSALSGRLAHRMPAERLILWAFALMFGGAILNLAYNAATSPALPWAVIPIVMYAFGAASALPGMTVATLSSFPGMQGLAASLQGFTQMMIFSLASGVVAPFLLGHPFGLACGMAAGLGVSSACWRLAAFADATDLKARSSVPIR
jgi:DHA1 family bicyclomycin/chloramphenicol resistance-like MFS transporter